MPPHTACLELHDVQAVFSYDVLKGLAHVSGNEVQAALQVQNQQLHWHLKRQGSDAWLVVAELPAQEGTASA